MCKKKSAWALQNKGEIYDGKSHFASQVNLLMYWNVNSDELFMWSSWGSSCFCLPEMRVRQVISSNGENYLRGKKVACGLARMHWLKKNNIYTCTTSHLGIELRISRGNSEHCTRTHNACCNECVGLIEKVAFVCCCCTFMCMWICVIKWGEVLQVACCGVLPRKQNTLGWGGINETGRGEGVEKEYNRGVKECLEDLI